MKKIINPEESAPQQSEAETIFRQSSDDNTYDLFKHMTTLTLVSMGGIMTIVSEDIVSMKPLALAVIVGLLALGGIGAFSGMVELAEARTSGEKRARRIAIYRKLASTGFGMGIGAFLSVFLLETLL